MKLFIIILVSLILIILSSVSLYFFLKPDPNIIKNNDNIRLYSQSYCPNNETNIPIILTNENQNLDLTIDTNNQSGSWTIKNVNNQAQIKDGDTIQLYNNNYYIGLNDSQQLSLHTDKNDNTYWKILKKQSGEDDLIKTGSVLYFVSIKYPKLILSACTGDNKNVQINNDKDCAFCNCDTEDIKSDGCKLWIIKKV